MQHFDSHYHSGSVLGFLERQAANLANVDLAGPLGGFDEGAPLNFEDASKVVQASTFLQTETFDQSEIARLKADWDDLCSRSLEETVYYAPGYASALLNTTARQDGIKFITARYGSRLTGLLPVVTNPAVVPGLMPGGIAWTSDYTFSTTPLIDRSLVRETVVALLQGLKTLKRSEWTMPLINLDGPCCKALIDAFQQQNIPWGVSGAFERASVSPGPDFDDYMSEHLSSKRRSELRRYRRRLEELGQVRHEVFTAGDDLSNAIEMFLDLEASGWKGKRGTALACNPATRAFAVSAFRAFNAKSRCRVDVLFLDDKPIAAGVIVFAGETGFTVKNAYDETYSKFGVGLLLEIEVLKSLLSEKWATRLDAATSGSHVIDQLWPDRKRVGSLVFSLAPRLASTRLSLLLRSMEYKAIAKTQIKRTLGL